MTCSGPYRDGDTVPYVCIVCFESRSNGPMDCGRCRTPQCPISDDGIYRDMLDEAERRVAAPYYIVPGVELTVDGKLRWGLGGKYYRRPLKPFADMTRDELLDWLIPPKRIGGEPRKQVFDWRIPSKR